MTDHKYLCIHLLLVEQVDQKVTHTSTPNKQKAYQQ